MDTLKFFDFQSSGKNPVTLFSARGLRQVLTPRVCLEALRTAYQALADDLDSEPKTLGFKVEKGSYHIKAGVYPKTRQIFAAKLNANFPGNPANGLPTIQGLVVLVDGTEGIPLAVMDSGELTALRTAASNALAASYGARENSSVATLIGCGMQSIYVLEAFENVLPLKKVFVLDRDFEKAKTFAKAAGKTRRIEIKPVTSLPEATLASDVIVTCTTSQKAFLKPEHIRKGTFIAALGADSAHKQELDPALFANARVLVDDLEKCALEAELNHVLKAGVLAKEDIAGDLCGLASGKVNGRESNDEIVIFDSLGTGLQDVAAAWAAYKVAAAWGAFKATQE